MDNPFIDILGGNKVAKSKHITTISPTTGLIAFGAMATIGAGIGAAIGTYVFFGTATLLGAIVVIESNPFAKKIVRKSTRAIDAVILITSIVAIGTLGVTVAASLTFAGLGYTLVYAPYLRRS